MPITYKLEHPDGTAVDPPPFLSSDGTSWNVGDVLYLGRRTLRVVESVISMPSSRRASLSKNGIAGEPAGGRAWL
jgi:hypothetical protein